MYIIQNLQTRLPFLIAVAVLAALACLILKLRRRCTCRNVLAVLCVAALAVAVLLLIRVQTPAGHQAEPSSEPIGTVTVSVSCDAVRTPGDILPQTETALYDGDSACSVLERILAKAGIDAEIRDGYVRSIDGLAEQAHGPYSGWTYRVNGETPTVGSASYVLHDGDRVEWIYSPSLF